MEKISGIYKITNLITNQFYIGSSKNIYLRWKDHKKPSTIKRCPNQKLYQDFILYGLDNFKFEILYNCDDPDLKRIESEFIKDLNPYYNINTTRVYSNKPKKAICGIYKITCKITGDFYIGSSSSIKDRWHYHRNSNNYKKYPNNLLYKAMHIYGIKNFIFEILEECDKSHLLEREQYYIDKYCPIYNKGIAKKHLSESDYQKDYYRKNREKILNYKSKWRKNNKEYESQKNREYYNRKCLYNNEVLTLSQLRDRLKKLGILNPTQEAQKYLIIDNSNVAV